MFDFLLVAQALNIVDQYFCEKAFEQDFWKVSIENYENFEQDKEKTWFTVDPRKLKNQYRTNTDILIVAEDEKNSLLKAFVLLEQYSNNLPATACLNERLLIAKNYLPPVFFKSKSHHDGCTIIPFKNIGTVQK